jgi:hypothetical protein
MTSTRRVANPIAVRRYGVAGMPGREVVLTILFDATTVSRQFGTTPEELRDLAKKSPLRLGVRRVFSRLVPRANESALIRVAHSDLDVARGRSVSRSA